MTRFIRDKDTICATITAPGQAGIAVVRVSGFNSDCIVRRIAPFLPEKLESHRIYYGILKDPDQASALDEVLVSYFESGKSFTGEMTFEISCHGSQVIAGEILLALVEGGARMAERGEFTYRAFMNGRIDLIQAESVLDMIQSQSKRSAQLALRQLQGGLSSGLREIQQDLTWVLANLEANIDFATEDIEIASPSTLSERVRSVGLRVDLLLGQHRQGRILKSGYHVVLVGQPNAGKSSLLNALLQEERAIVTPVPGTTRDLVEGEVAIDGYRVLITDTAGLRDSSDCVERIGIDRALMRAKEADAVFYVIDGERGWQTADDRYLQEMSGQDVDLIWNKVDVAPIGQVPTGNRTKGNATGVSALTREGIDLLMGRLGERLKSSFLEDTPALLNARHFEGLEKLHASLEVGYTLLERHASPDLIALELQEGLRIVHELLGLVFDDEVMDRVFSEFCIGK